MPPIFEPAKLLRPCTRLKTETFKCSTGNPTITSEPSGASNERYWLILWGADMVSRIKSCLGADLRAAWSVVKTAASAQSLWASASFSGEVVKTVTVAPIAFAILIARCPNPPIQRIQTFFPGPICRCLSGE